LRIAGIFGSKFSDDARFSFYTYRIGDNYKDFIRIGFKYYKSIICHYKEKHGTIKTIIKNPFTHLIRKTIFGMDKKGAPNENEKSPFQL